MFPSILLCQSFVESVATDFLKGNYQITNFDWLRASALVLFTFPDGLSRVCIHRGCAVLGYFELAENESGLSDFSEARQVSVGVLNHVDLLNDKTLLLELSSDVCLRSRDINFAEFGTAPNRANGKRNDNNSKVPPHNILRNVRFESDLWVLDGQGYMGNDFTMFHVESGFYNLDARH